MGEAADGWELPLAGYEVTRVYVEADLAGALLDGGPIAELQVEGAAARESLLPLLGARVAQAAASREGRLELRFADGRTLAVDPRRGREAWSLVGPGFTLVALAGGGVELLP